MILCSVFLMAATLLFSTENRNKDFPKPKKVKPTSLFSDIDYGIGMMVSFNQVPIVLNPASQNAQLENTLNFYYSALNLDASFSDYLSLTAIVGYNINKLRNPLDFINLPLTLRWKDKSVNAPVFGLRVRSDFYSWNDFSVSASGTLLFFTTASAEYPIHLPIVFGNSRFSNHFNQAILEILVKYEGFSNFDVYAGPQFHAIRGTLTASETIQALQGREDLTYKQRKTSGLTGGIEFEAGNIDVDFRITVIAKTTASVTLSYAF